MDKLLHCSAGKPSIQVKQNIFSKYSEIQLYSWHTLDGALASVCIKVRLLG